MRIRRVIALLAVTLLAVAAANEGSLSLQFSSKGNTFADKDGAKSPYQSGETVQIAQEELLKLVGENKVEAGASWDVPADAVGVLFKNFEKSAEVKGTLKLSVKEIKEEKAELTASGTVAINATENDGKTKRNIEAALEGALTYDVAAKKVLSIVLEGKDVKVTGTATAESGETKLAGEGTIALKSSAPEGVVAAKPESPQPGKGPGTGFGPKAGGGFGPGAGGGGPGGGGFGGGPSIDKDLLIGQALTRLNVRMLKRLLDLTPEQEEKVTEMIKGYASGWGAMPEAPEPGKAPKMPNPNEMREEAVGKLKEMLTEDQKKKFEEYLAKQPGGQGKTNTNTNQNSNQNTNKKSDGQAAPPQEEPKKEEPKKEETPGGDEGKEKKE